MTELDLARQRGARLAQFPPKDASGNPRITARRSRSSVILAVIADRRPRAGASRADAMGSPFTGERCRGQPHQILHAAPGRRARRLGFM